MKHLCVVITVCGRSPVAPHCRAYRFRKVSRTGACNLTNEKTKPQRGMPRPKSLISDKDRAVAQMFWAGILELSQCAIPEHLGKRKDPGTKCFWHRAHFCPRDPTPKGLGTLLSCHRCWCPPPPPLTFSKRARLELEQFWRFTISRYFIQKEKKNQQQQTKNNCRQAAGSGDKAVF